MGVNAWVVHRDPTVFGYNVNKFDPTRWLASDKGNKGKLSNNRRNAFFKHGYRY